MSSPYLWTWLNTYTWHAGVQADLNINAVQRGFMAARRGV
jgi:hypothetical protein